MNVLVSGSTGLIGEALVSELEAGAPCGASQQGFAGRGGEVGPDAR